MTLRSKFGWRARTSRRVGVASVLAIALAAFRCGSPAPTRPSDTGRRVIASLSPVPIRAEPERLGGPMNRYRLAGDAIFRGSAGTSGRITQLAIAIARADGQIDTRTVGVDLAIDPGRVVTYRISQTIDSPSANPPERLQITAGGVDQDGKPLTIDAADAPVIASSPATSGPFNHVFIVLEENLGFENAIGNPQMPFLNQLASQFALATQYYANGHPSIGNYFMLTVGRIVTAAEDYAGLVSDDNVVRRLLASGLTWKSYAEDLPSVGYTGGNFGSYVRRHNVFATFDDVVRSATQVKNLVPFTHFAGDLAANALPNYAFIVPNLCNDGHDCPPSTVDAWLQANIGPLIGSAQFQRDGLLIITYDEAGDADTRYGGGRIAWIAVSGRSKRGYRSSTLYQHQNTLRLTLQALGVTAVPGMAAGASDMSEFFY